MHHVSAVFTRNYPYTMHVTYFLLRIKKFLEADNHLTYVEVLKRRVQGNVPTPV